MDISEEQFSRAFPSLPHCQHPSLANGYGWLGNGFGWQVEPLWGSSTSTERKDGTEVQAPDVFTIDDPLEAELTDSSINMHEYLSTLSSKITPQNFHKLRDEHFQKGNLFEDPDFPATITSLRFNPNRKEFEGITWLRPKEIATSPKLFVDGPSRFDVLQGQLNNCWFVASVANLATHRNVLRHVIPEDQSFDKNYAGIFRFRFWQFGKWIDLVIDDRLPTKNGKLHYMKSEAGNEFWSALLEKAYAKLYGCYQVLELGFNIEGLQDLTGGVTEVFPLRKNLPNLPKLLIDAFSFCSLISVLIRKLSNNDFVDSTGLKRGHCYIVTSVAHLKLPNQKEKILLLRLRNPWCKTEWKGAWSDKSPEWEHVPQALFENKSVEMASGEFWMSFNDFERHCDYLEICHFTPDLLSQEQLADTFKKRWEVSVLEGSWVKGFNAGGKDNNELNPQYRITITEADDDEEDAKCSLIIALTQKYRRAIKLKGVHVLPIGFVVYSIPTSYRGSKRLNRQFFKGNSPIGGSPAHVGKREVNCLLRLSRGTYCIVPSTTIRGVEASFLLRVFSEDNVNMLSCDDDIEVTPLDSRISNRIPTIEEQEIDKRAENMILKFANQSLDVGWLELKGILDSTMKEETKNRGFSEGICRSIVALSDRDRSGKLDYEEFNNLWIDMKNLKTAFKLFDADDSGTLNGSELREALNSAGYVVDGEILTDIIRRHGNKESEINFEDFIMCALKLKAMIELFKSKKNSKSNTAQFSLEELVSILYS